MLALIKKLLKAVFLLFILVIIVVPVGLLIALVMAVDDRPLIEGTRGLTSEDVRRARALVAEHDPRRQRDAQLRRMHLKDDEVELLLTHVLSRGRPSAVTFSSTPGAAIILASISIPKTPLGTYLNVQAVIGEREPLVTLERLKIGSLPVPAWLAEIGIEMAFAEARTRYEIPDPLQLVKAVELRDRAVTVTYQWQEKIVRDVRDRLIRPIEQQRLEAYTRKLAEHLVSTGKQHELVELLRAMIGEVSRRSQTRNINDEMRAAILVLAAYVNNRNLALIIPDAAQWPKAKRTTLMLHQRKDLASHFLISAALAVAAGSELSMAVGLSKEIDDSRGGSGFSFIDLAADEAGTRYGEFARTRARELVNRTLEGLDDSKLLPLDRSLDERLTEAQFKARYGGVDSTTYREVLQNIRSKINASVLYR